MADHRITDFVDQAAIDSLKTLKSEISAVKDAYVETAKELIKGLNLKVDSIEQLEKLTKLVADQQQRAAESTQRLTAATEAYRQGVANTSNTISRELAEMEKVNKTTREAYTDHDKVKSILEKVNGSYENNLKNLLRLSGEISKYKDQLKELKKGLDVGALSMEQYNEQQFQVTKELRALQLEHSNLQRLVKNEEKEMQSTAGSYNHLSQQLELLKKAYKELGDSDTDRALAAEMEPAIQALDAHLKDLAADMGEFQRNVGNYAIANGSVKKELKDLVLEIANLSVAYRNLSEEEKNSAEGQAMKDKIQQMTERAGELRDAVADTTEAIKNAASDTRGFDQISGGIQLIIDGFGLATGAATMLGISEDDLVEIQTKLQAAIVASNAITKVQTALQKQSAVMQGVAIIQTKAAMMATKMKTAAESESIVVSKAATIAQAAFNAVAYANPYVLLAMAIVTVVGALAAFTLGTNEASKAEERHQKELEETKRRQEDFATAVANSAATEINAFMKLKREWDSLGDSMAKKDKFIHDNRKAMDKLGLAVKDVSKAEKVFRDNTDAVIKAFILRAKAAALQSEMLKAQERYVEALIKAESGMQKGETVSIEDAANANWQGVERKHWWSNEYEITDADKFNKEMKPYLIAQATEQLNKEIDKLTELMQKTDEELQQTYDSMGMVDGKSDSGGSGRGSTEKDNSKSLSDFDNESIKKSKTLYDQLASYQKEGTDKWLEYRRKAIILANEMEERSAKDNHDKTLASLEESLKAGKLTQEQYNDIKKREEEQYAQSVENIHTSMQNAIAEAEHKVVLARVKDIQDQSAAEQAIQDQRYAEYLANRKQQYADDLEAAAGNFEEQDRITAAYERDLAERAEQYAIARIQSQRDMMQAILDEEDLTADERADIEAKLAKLTTDLDDSIADAAVAQQEREREAMEETTNKAKEEYEKRKQAAQQWLQVASQGLNAIADLTKAVFDGKIQRIEAELEATSEATEKETGMITELVEKKVISEEEGEARKRAAEAKTAQKQEELEKKKQQLKHKQALWDKANGIAQAGISTALAVLNALQVKPYFPVGVAMAAMAAAMGAVQVATILATPIPKYAKGTDFHPGGLAIVGDAGKQEVVLVGDSLYLTPSTPTMIDMPKGAAVYPDVDNFITETALTPVNTEPSVIVHNDYQRLERRMQENNDLLKRLLKETHSANYNQAYQAYKNSRI